ncbi:MAG: glycosyltransferase family 39 protein [Rubrobacter sp.]|nr:glycosyltransferase family 39 protein [Rubrobacter sp.]
MTEELTQKRNTVADGVRTSEHNASWHRLALIAVLILSAFLNLFRLTDLGYGNAYYAAAVKDMLTSWHNFFFVSFDAGFVTVDKPPLGLWIQAASAELFGFHGWSLLLPQALAGVLSAALLYHLVRNTFGPVAGILAALVFAVTPIAIAVERTNNSDGLLVLTVLVAAWAVIRAVNSGRLRWLLVGVFLVGLGFNIKMLEAYLVLPALYLLYLVAPVSWWRRFVHLGVATVVLLVVSLSWAVAVDLTPTDQRPYVGSSSSNSELDLAFGYNGANRLLGWRGGAPVSEEQPEQQGSALQGDAPGGGGFGPFGARETGEAGPLRLFDEQLAGQIGWLLPLAVVGLLVVSWQNRPRLPFDQQPPQGLRLWRRWFLRVVSFLKNLPLLSLDQRQGALVLWGMWLLTMAVFFSVAGMFHRYYMVMLAPAIAALVGVGVVALWSDYRRVGWRGWLLPLTLLGMAALQTYIVLDYYDEDWSRWLPPAIMGLCLVAAVTLIVLRLRPRPKVSNYAASVGVVGILALLIAPTVWAAYTVWQGNAMLPAAGPQTVQGSSWGGPPGVGPMGSQSGGRGEGFGSDVDPALINYLRANRDDAKYLVATTNAMSASPIILNANEPDPVIALGGFIGRDPVLTSDEVTRLVDEGALRFFLVPDMKRMGEMMSEYASSQSSSQQQALEDFLSGGRSFLQNEPTDWVQDNCEQVPQELWQSSSSSDQEGGIGTGMMRAQILYDCGAKGQ